MCDTTVDYCNCQIPLCSLYSMCYKPVLYGEGDEGAMKRGNVQKVTDRENMNPQLIEEKKSIF